MPSRGISRRNILKCSLGAAAGIALAPTARPEPLWSMLQPPPGPPSPLAASVGGYFTPDGFRHAVVGTAAGKLHEVFFDPNRGKGIAPLACFEGISRVAGFFTADDGFQHHIGATPDGDVHEVFYKPNDIHYALEGGPSETGTDIQLCDTP